VLSDYDQHDDLRKSVEFAYAFIRERVAKGGKGWRGYPMNEHVRWAVSRWEAEVKNRPLQNIHRRSLDDTWRQVIRHYGGDDVGLCGLPHDELLEPPK